MIDMIRKITSNPYLNLISGLILLITSASEIVGDVYDGIGVHHGIAFFGLIHTIRCIPEILHGAEQISKINERERVRW